MPETEEQRESRLHVELQAQLHEIQSVRVSDFRFYCNTVKKRFDHLRNLLAESENSIYSVQDAVQSLTFVLRGNYT